MTNERLTEKLASQILGWKTAPGRFIKPNRSWLPNCRFAPLTNLDQAFDLLERINGTFTLSTVESGLFQVEVHVGDRVGKASGEPKARAITLALAQALGIEVDDAL